MRYLLAATIAAIVPIAAACSSSSKPASTVTSAPGASSGAGVTVSTASEPQVGTVLVTSSGRALYMFSPDQQKSVTCTGSCASAWPPLITSGAPVAGPGVQASLLGTIQAPGGHTQVTYNHWPLYTYSGDSGPGQANGQGISSFGGSWSTLTPSGQAPSASSSSPSTTASHGYGY